MENDNPRGNILIVDDEPELREIISDIISPLNLQISTAQNGKEALEIVRNTNIDVVISDIKMPEMTGIEFLSHLREEHFSTIVIFVTGFGDKELMRQAWNLGAFDFIDKPINEVYLLDITKSALAYGKSFVKARTKEGNNSEKMIVSIESSLHQEFMTLCKEKNLDKDSIVNSLLAKYIASGTK